NEEIVLGRYIFALLNRDNIRKEAEKNMTGSSGHRRVPASFYADYRIPFPDLITQQQLITEITAQEANIAAAQAIIDAAASKKQAILKQYLYRKRLCIQPLAVFMKMGKSFYKNQHRQKAE
ncbi:MAG: hypothetical protein QX196_02090, partial [Methylococcaceae bacterium]